MQRQRGITLDQKVRYLKEVENIHALAKKVKPPAGKSWSDVADERMRFIMGQPILEKPADPLRIRKGRLHHEHSPRSARIIERTLKTGMLPPDVLHSYHTGRDIKRPKFRFKDIYMPEPRADPEDVRVQHVVQHVASDLHYPHGHMQGEGFVPRQHEFNSLVEVTSSAPSVMQVPTKDGAAAGSHFH